jgi:hypothetical protein
MMEGLIIIMSTFCQFVKVVLVELAWHIVVGLVQAILVIVVLLVVKLFRRFPIIQIEIGSLPNGLVFSLPISFSFIPSPYSPSSYLCEFTSLAHRFAC